MLIEEYTCNKIYNSIKDILYNEDTIYFYCNFNTSTADKVLEELLKIDVINKEGILVPLSTINLNKIDNYFMLISNEVKETVEFIYNTYSEHYSDKKLKIFLDNYTNEDFEMIRNLYNNMIDVTIYK